MINDKVEYDRYSSISLSLSLSLRRLHSIYLHLIHHGRPKRAFECGPHCYNARRDESSSRWSHKRPRSPQEEERRSNRSVQSPSQENRNG
ncbi:hypothetical protein IGI04_037832 [Brassica rapa subsp. trilocularis]|uniref:Uncharacterized protein n=1 Tax=Brassica rapa subsp. trilocularis TaxID=1813537 RepID=A0ABQ7LIJ2_BRACM|nr:hypothetical protein IGI04_037832 [Brassica rapa subsp. trilocularis]